MSHPLKREYSTALVVALALHAGAMLSLDSPPKGNAPRDGYRMEFSLGAYGGADTVVKQQQVEQQEPEPEPVQEQVEKMVQEVVEPEVFKPAPEPVITEKLPEADFALKKKPEPKIPEKKIEPKPVEKQITKPKPRVKPKPVIKPVVKKEQPKPVVKTVQKKQETPVVKQIKTTKIAGAKAFGRQQTTGASGTNKSVTTGVSGGIRGVRIDYMTRLQKYLARYKKYPRRARKRHQEGTSVVEFMLTSSGKIQSAAIKTSSGFRLLDKEALAMLKRANPLPQPPKGFIQNSKKIILPISFSLRTG